LKHLCYRLLMQKTLVASMCTTGNPYQRIGSAEIGTVLDMYTELQRDDEPHDQLASQDDMDRF